MNEQYVVSKLRTPFNAKHGHYQAAGNARDVLVDMQFPFL